MIVLPREDWQRKQQLHRDIVEPWISPRLDRRSHHLKHPVDDFLFEYYPISPAKIRTWHPGADYALEITETDRDDFPSADYCVAGDTLRVDAQWLSAHHERFTKILELLQATQQRSARSGCFGLHEWAMVLGDNSVRHADWKLRLSDGEIQNTIDSVGLRCTHYDAFRFFTETARPLNPLQLTRGDQVSWEQPGCLHANMDLHKYATSVAPLVGSDLARSCFALAREIRTVDMQVAPYDLTDLGIIPIYVETPAGREEFARRQLAFTQTAKELRAQLISKLNQALATAN